MVIDEDLGKSGSSAVARTGFQRLVTEIGMDRVGLVLGIEMSRLARSGKDWYQLIELCAISGALLADTEGVYDPGNYNDRLLLGLKGAMAEAEPKQRMQAGRLSPTGPSTSQEEEAAAVPEQPSASAAEVSSEAAGTVDAIDEVLEEFDDLTLKELGFRKEDDVDPAVIDAAIKRKLAENAQMGGQ